MSQKIVLAVAATAALAATTTEARGGLPDWASSTGPYNPNPPFRGFDEEEQRFYPSGFNPGCKGLYCGLSPKERLGLFEEEESVQKKKINWGKVVKGINTGLDLYGKAKGVGLFEEEEGGYWELNGGASNGPNGQTNWNIGGKVGGTWEEEEEQLQKKKINWGKVANAIGTGLDLYGKAKGVGLFEEEEVQKFKNWDKVELPRYTCMAMIPACRKGLDLDLFEEEEGGYWEVTGGVSGGQGGRPNWNIGGKIGGTFEEEEEEKAQKLQVDRAFNTAVHILVQANKMGLLEEDADLDEVQKIKLGKVVSGALKVVKVAGAAGLLEEAEWNMNESGTNFKDFWGSLNKAIDGISNFKNNNQNNQVLDEEEGNGYWSVGGGYDSRSGWNVGAQVGWRFDEEEFMAPPPGSKFPRGVVFDEDEIMWPTGTGGIKPPRFFAEEEVTAPKELKKVPRFPRQHGPGPRPPRPDFKIPPHPDFKIPRKPLLHKKLQRQVQRGPQ